MKIWKIIEQASVGVSGTYRHSRAFPTGVFPKFERYPSERTQPGSAGRLYRTHQPLLPFIGRSLKIQNNLRLRIPQPHIRQYFQKGYSSAYTPDTLQKARQAGIIDAKVMALGGVTVAHFPEISSSGFGGAVLLGDIWKRTGTDFIGHFKELLRSASLF